MILMGRPLLALVLTIGLALAVVALLLLTMDTAGRPSSTGMSLGGASVGRAQIGDGATACGEGLRVHVAGDDVDVVHTRLRRADTEVDCGPGLHGWVSGRGREVLALCLPSKEAAGAEPFVYIRTQPAHPSVKKSGRVVVDVFPALASEGNGRTKSWLFGRAGLSELRLFILDGDEEVMDPAALADSGSDATTSGWELSGKDLEAEAESAGRGRMCARVLATVELKKNAGVPELAGMLDEGGVARVEGAVALIR